MLIYDIEIKKAILGKKESPFKGIEYCDGWQDHANMGISCICCYDYETERYRAFMDDNMSAFQTLCCDHDIIVGFNNIGFDNKVIRANGMMNFDSVSYDLLREIWIGAGLSPEFKFPSHIGYGLDAVCDANFGHGKTGHGALAPVDFQRGKYGNLIDYCLGDIWLTKQLLDLVIKTGRIINPKDGQIIKINRPK